MELCVYKLFFYTVAGRQFGDASSLQTGSLHFQNKRNMEFYASGKKKFYLPKSNYQPNIDAGLLAHVREEVFKREEEQRKQREVDEAKKTEDEKRTKLGRQIHSIVPNLPMYVGRCQKFDSYSKEESTKSKIFDCIIYIPSPLSEGEHVILIMSRLTLIQWLSNWLFLRSPKS